MVIAAIAVHERHRCIIYVCDDGVVFVMCDAIIQIDTKTTITMTTAHLKFLYLVTGIRYSLLIGVLHLILDDFFPSYTMRISYISMLLC